MYDCALFDIDGVLVDIRKSYNSAIKKTVEFMLFRLSGRSFRGLVTDKVILRFRQTGGFNNDTDTSYAIILAMLANPQKNVVAGRRFLARVAESADETGITSVEKFLASFGIEKWKRKLAYPAPVKDSVLARVFDELFYGPELFRKQNSLEPKYSRGRPLIKNDRLVVSGQTMKRLHMMFCGKLAIVSGRSRVAADYSLGPVMKYFDLGASVFLEDEKREYAKPNIFAIKHAMEAMDAKTAAYAGDSAEDLLMARRAEKELDVRIDFVGIYGYSVEPKKIAAGFRNEGVAAIASINQLTRTLEARS
jgi:phosphoglycolate phosphatase-like HAD superfamily hydrolase